VPAGLVKTARPAADDRAKGIETEGSNMAVEMMEAAAETAGETNDASTPAEPALAAMHAGGPADRVTVSDPRWSTLIAYSGLSTADLRRMPHLSSAVDRTQELTDQLTAHVSQFPELVQIIVDNSSVERLMGKLAKYFVTMFEGRYDDATVAHRVFIGEVHDRINLPLGAYLGAFLQLDDVVIREIVERFQGDPEALHTALMTYRRVSQTDAALVARASSTRGKPNPARSRRRCAARRRRSPSRRRPRTARSRSASRPPNRAPGACAGPGSR